MAQFWRMGYKPDYGAGWSFGSIRDAAGLHIDERAFTRGEPLVRPDGLTLPLYPFGERRSLVRLPLRAEVDRPGRRTDLTFAGVAALVVSARLAEVFRRHAAGDIELFPTVADRDTDPAHYVLNVARTLDAMDRERSALSYYPADAPAVLAGRIAHVSKLVIREEVAVGVGCFRPQDWVVQLVVSAELRQAIRSLGAPEIEFAPV